MTWLLSTKLGRAIAMAGAAFATVAAILWRAYAMGRKAQQADTAEADAREYKHTTERMQNAGNDIPDDDALRDWLRDRGKR